MAKILCNYTHLNGINQIIAFSFLDSNGISFQMHIYISDIVHDPHHNNWKQKSNANLNPFMHCKKVWLVERNVYERNGFCFEYDDQGYQTVQRINDTAIRRLRLCEYECEREREEGRAAALHEMKQKLHSLIKRNDKNGIFRSLCKMNGFFAMNAPSFIQQSTHIKYEIVYIMICVDFNDWNACDFRA